MLLEELTTLALENYYACMVWDINNSKVLFEGRIKDIPNKYLSMKVGSWELDDDGFIGFNVY